MGEVLALVHRRNPNIPTSLTEDPGTAAESEVARMPSGHPRSRAAHAKRDRWLRLQAIQIVTMLPDDIDEARRILEYARALVTEFIEKDRRLLDVVRPD